MSNGFLKVIGQFSRPEKSNKQRREQARMAKTSNDQDV